MDEIRLLGGSMKSLYESGSYSDLIIRYGDDEYKLHRAIVCPRSEVIARACKDCWQDGDFVSTVHLHRDESVDTEEAVLFRLMIHYLYLLDYKKPSEDKMLFASTQTKTGVNQRAESHHFEKSEIESLESELILHPRMYSLADYYQIPELKEVAKKKFAKAAKVSWNAPEFGRAVYIIFKSTSSTDRGLREIVRQTLRDHPELMDKTELEEAIREMPDLAYDALAVTRAQLKALEAKCRYCQSPLSRPIFNIECIGCYRAQSVTVLPLSSERAYSDLVRAFS